ncbi:DUF2855 family protein [Caulobacter mirabilis]|uniref:DUF2855 domain-containing protein n=1 Tax=Caulobacter mirabilis TaxID=69666 RepID=A0A2D2AUE8_9CAUL|nr:DUF2855 family protein [Caulobacter mirabilis]ATQ41629.1 hypothetical protein CSW64_03975 [Caulobacter mirabilis]
MTIQGWDLIVGRDKLNKTHVVEAPAVAPADGEVRLRIESFALTANNVTYAMAGDQLGYWQFFPAPEGWGRIPVWGYGVVEVSRHPDFQPGERFYGYWPMSSHLVAQPRRTPAGFIDDAPHRAPLPPTYNLYQSAPAGGDFEAERSVILFTTSFLLEDFLEESDFHGARSVILTSASSRTAIGLAHRLKAAGKVKVVGLTSPRNQAFVEALGYYDQVVLYDDFEAAPVATPAVLVDFAGDAGLIRRIHERFGDELKYSCLVGLTHWQDFTGGQSEPMPGPAPIFFFAPDRITKRRQDWGPEGFHQRHDAAWRTFAADTGRWLKIQTCQGAEAAKTAYLAVLAGEARPDQGIIVKP